MHQVLLDGKLGHILGDKAALGVERMHDIFLLSAFGDQWDDWEIYGPHGEEPHNLASESESPCPG